MKITYTEVEQNLRDLSKNINNESYIYDFLSCFGTAKATITRLKNKFSNTDELVSNGQVHFKYAESNLEEQLKELSSSKSLKKNKIRFVVVTDYKTIFAYDIKLDETIQVAINELHYEFEFFLPIAGMERASLATESPADAKAADKMARLFDVLKGENETETEEQIHAMNVFLSRLLFCFFAEDTGIYEKDQFTKTLGALTQDNGSDVHIFLEELFEVLNSKERTQYSNNLASFPFVNGGLFADKYDAPKFNTRARRALLECGSLDWSEINPDIFGSMIQAVVDNQYRSHMGMHYTSVTNIMKVLEPLFLTKLTEAFLNILSSDVKDETKLKNLKSLVERISKIKIGDMACGSGNFLIIAYKELRQLEMKIIKEIRKLEGFEDQLNLLMGAPESSISLGQFYGIEYDDFACGIAILSLWLVEHQMNQQFNEEFGASEATLPLKSFNNIRHGNALRFEWSSILPNNGEVYVIGNPPFYGYKMQTKEQKEDLKIAFTDFIQAKNLDYVCGWYAKAALFLEKNQEAMCSLVSTNSICQGESVAILWKPILEKRSLEIGFAHTSFKWRNSAKDNAGVTCCIIGLRHKSNEPKFIFKEGIKNEVKNINGYLVDSENVFVDSSRKPLNDLSPICKGNAGYDNNNLILEANEREELLEKHPESSKFIRKYVGSKELIHSLSRWCIWIEDDEVDEAMDIEFIRQRLIKIKEYRLASSRAGTIKAAEKFHSFAENRHQSKPSLVIPVISSERREYLPIEICDKNTVSGYANFMIYDFDDSLFAILLSKMHMVWIKAVCGSLETRIRYSNTLCYNTLPLPLFTESDIATLKDFTNKIVKQRILSGKTLAELYDPEKMPDDIKGVHSQLDKYIDTIYQKSINRSKPILNDSHRLEVLFKMYADMKEAS